MKNQTAAANDKKVWITCPCCKTVLTHTELINGIIQCPNRDCRASVYVWVKDGDSATHVVKDPSLEENSRDCFDTVMRSLTFLFHF